MVSGVAAAMLVLGWAGTAGADPIKKGPPITVNCDNGVGTVQIVSPNDNEHPNWTPGLVTTSNLVGIPYEVHIVETFTPIVGEPHTFTTDIVKPAPHSGRLATCTFHAEGSNPDGTSVADGTVKISFSGSH